MSIVMRETNEQHPEKNQLSFLMKGEHAFTRAFQLAKNEDEHDQDKKSLVAAAAIDLLPSKCASTSPW